VRRIALLGLLALPAAVAAAAPGAEPEPERGRSVVLEPVSGELQVRPA